EAEARDARGFRRVAGEPGRLVADGLGQAIGAVESGRSTGERTEQLAELGPEDRVLPDGVVCLFKLREGGHQRLGDVAAAEIALHPPAARAVRVEQPGRDGRRSEREVWPVVARGPCAL